jgi:methionyl-tRNA synthetase
MRTIVMTNKYFDGAVPKQGKLEKIDEELIKKSDVLDEADKCMQKLEVNKAVEIVWEFIRHCNKYINETEPWKIKDKERLGTVLYNLIESMRIISILVSPFVPETAEKISKQLGLKMGSFRDAKFSGKTKGKIGKPEILIKKMEVAEEDPIARFDFRVGKVISAADHPNADKLYVLKVRLDKERQLVAGLKGYMNKDDIVGKNVIVVANLKPAKLKGIESQGMLLAAEKNGNVALLEAPKSNLNDRAIFKEGTPAAEVTIDEFAKLKITIKGKKVLLDKLVLKTGAEEVKANIEDGAAVK